MNIKQLRNILKKELSNFEFDEFLGQRSVADKIESDCSLIVKKAFSKEFVKAKSKRSVEDFSIIKKEHSNFFDVKTHFIQKEKGFSMPNLISIKRLKKILETNNQSLIYVFVDYTRNKKSVIIKNIHIKYVWELDWNILRIGALGKGQLQIKNANNELMFTSIGKEKWFSILKKEAVSFYKKQIKNIEKEINNW